MRTGKPRLNREAELSPFVSEWMRVEFGCSVYAEISFSSKVIDHVGVRWSDEFIVAVEMKTALTWKVLRQAHLAQLVTPESWAAVGTTPRKKSLETAAQYGIGVWANGKILLRPEPRHTVSEKYRALVLDHCRNRAEGGIGGLPTLKGDGPRIRCVEAVRAFLANNPSASWKQIYSSVPNHYAHYRSMQGAMPPREYLLPATQKASDVA